MNQEKDCNNCKYGETCATNYCDAVWNRAYNIRDGKDCWKSKTPTAEERLLDAGYEDVIIFKDYSYDDALIGVSDDNRAIYDYEKMIEWLMQEEGWTDNEAVEWIEVNTLRALPYFGAEAPIIMYPLAYLGE